MEKSTRFAGKTVLITGANNPLGIGAATAKLFAKQGAEVFITYLKLPPSDQGVSFDLLSEPNEPSEDFYYLQRAKAAEEVVREITEEGGIIESFEADLIDEKSIKEIFLRALDKFGKVDILVNNASHYAEKDSIESISAREIVKTFKVNLRAATLLTAEYFKSYKEKNLHGGRIINLSTDSARCFAGQIIFGASKSAIESITRSLALELGPSGITVNCVAPGPTQTGYIHNDKESSLIKQIPLRRLGKPEDIAKAILFFASDEADWITGQVLQVSGGHAL